MSYALVVATPCPLLIGIPVAIIGSISLAARRGIIIKNPVLLEQIDRCRTAIFDKTGTLTYGQPKLTGISAASGFHPANLLLLAASLERYSKHPLARAILDAAAGKSLALSEATRVSEPPGQGLRGIVAGQNVELTNHKKLLAKNPAAERQLPPISGGLECLILINETYAGSFTFRDEAQSRPSSPALRSRL